MVSWPANGDASRVVGTVVEGHEDKSSNLERASRGTLDALLTRVLPSWLPAICLIASVGQVAAQTRFAAVVGEVTDPAGAAVAGADVTVRHPATGLQRSTTSDRNGQYVLQNLPPGTYDLTAAHAGLVPGTVAGQELFVGTTTTVNLSLGLPGREEVVEVSATATPLVEATKNEMGQVIQRAEIDGLPVVARTFSSLALLTPTVQEDVKASGLSIAGQRGFNSNFLVDGVTNRSSQLGGQLIAFSQDWIDEFRVSTAGYDAEFGNASGGIINVVTRSGANDFHGRVFAYFRDEGLDATPALTTSKTKLLEQRPGGYLSGPIAKEKAFFFAGFEYLNSDREAIVTSPLEACRPPARRDRGTGNCLAPAGDDRKLYLVKANWHLSPTSIVDGRYNRQDSSDFNSGVGGLSTVEHGRSSQNDYWGLSGAWTRIFGASATNELRAAFNRAHPLGRTNAGQTFEIQRPSGLLGAPVNYGLIAEEWIQLVDNVSFVRGAHTAKFGLTFSNIRYFGNFRNFRDGQYAFPTDKPFSVSDPSTHPLQFIIVEGGTTWDARANLLGVFGQDSWRISPRLVLNYGIRYDTDDSLAISGAKRVHTLSPRLGFAWSLDQQAKTVVRASGGMFRDSEHTNLADVFILNNRLLDRAVILNWNPAFGGLFNPLYDPVDPAGSAARLRQYLADAYAQGRTPDLTRIPARSLARSVNGIDSDFTVPVNRQLTLGIAHELTRSMAVSADFIYSTPKSLLVWRNVNISPQGTAIDPSFGSKTFAGSLAEGTYRALALRFDVRQAAGHAGLSYTWARCDDNTSGTLGGDTATNPFDLSVDAGPCDTDVRHTLVIRGGARLPLGLEASSIFTARSAPPYSATTSASLPLLTRYEPRNRRRGSGFSSWDVRLGRETRIKRLSARVFLEAFNVLNHRNFSAYVANVSSAQFGLVSDAFPPRRLQIGVRMDF
ncbi:MAG TPA: TonB-dependent receptor [Vicinamibacterales bacterium]|nr:TonB-dependent receptor [Vicinamibacterales bacterium]